MSEKRVRVCVEVDSHFVRLLAANVTWSNLREKAGRLTPQEVLALSLYAEMRGGTEVEVDLLIPPEWRPHFEVIHTERRVTEHVEAAP